MTLLKTTLWKANSVIILFGVLLMFAGMVGDNWWIKYDAFETVNFGLWRVCTKKIANITCSTRQGVLSFKVEPEKDWLITLLLVTALFAVMSLMTSVYLSFNNKKEKRIAVIFLIIFTLANVLLSISFIAFTETMFYRELSLYSRGWCLYVIWVGSLIFGLAYTATCIIVCYAFKVKKIKSNETDVHFLTNIQAYDSILYG